jgi:hypothetical protein
VIYSIWMVVFLILAFAPGYHDRPPLERPKKGFWRVADVLYPWRKALRELRPRNPKLLQAYSGSLVLAAFLAGGLNLAALTSPAFEKAMSPFWISVECAALTFLVGRAFGLWSADRKIESEKDIDRKD